MKLGLVLEGGAHRTVFSCGVMDALLDAGIRADYVIGSSAGITYAASYVSQQHGRNREMLRRFVKNPRYQGFHHRLNPLNASFYNLKFVFDTIPNKLLPFDYRTYNQFKGDVIAAVTDMATGEAVYMPVSGDDPKWTVLRATCALPLMFRPIKIDGKRYADGGVADSIPFQKALDDGCDKLLVILTRERDYCKEEEAVMQYAVRSVKKKYPAYAEKLSQRHFRYNDCIEQIARREQAGEIYVIAPEDTLGVKRTDTNLSRLMSLYAQGYAMTMQQLPQLKQYLQTEEKRQDTNG
ncbi:MAG: patatin family protein [Oscillospiraceae bacterium]|nr:patatin family protein [Oscillospiraceae bacterium]